MKFVLSSAIFALALCSGMVLAATTHTAKAGKYSVDLAYTAPLAVGEIPITLTVKDGGKPVNGAGVALHLDMVGMSMPVDVKTTPGKGDGQYAATVNLAMAGQWTLTANVEGMAGMAMAGDGKAGFTLTVPASGVGTNPSPATQQPAPTARSEDPPTGYRQTLPTAPPAGLPIPLILGALAVIGVIVGVALARSRGTKSA